MALVYKHYKEDTKELFYIGIGLKKERAYSKKSRNDFWHNIVKKHGYYVEIHIDNISYSEAKKQEKKLISLYGRLDLNNGILCNMTDGGDGNIGMSQNVKDKISNSLKGKKINPEIAKKRAEKQKNLWNSDEYALKRQEAKKRAIKYHSLGIISRLGKESPKKGMPFAGDKEKLSISLKEYYKTNNVWNKKNYKINQYDLKGNFIKTYNSHHEVLGVLPKRILEVCQGKRKSTKKYKFEFYESKG